MGRVNLGFILGVLRARGALGRHERWSRTEIDRQQAADVAALRTFAVERSPFYRRFHAGFEGRPLTELPILTKAQLMESFDELVTDPEVRLADLQRFLATLDGYRLFRGRYWVARTAGSSGHPGVFLWNRREWTAVVASYSRAQAWAGIDVNLRKRTRLAVVSSKTPWHQSALVGLSVDSPFVPVRRFDATSPLEEIVAGLNDWRPDNLVCYASMGRVLAEEQLAGRLAISPRAVICSSEVLTAESRRRIHQAFGIEPFEVYAATEPAGIAAECDRRRLHLFEDLVVTEVVDERNRPVPPGVVGAKVLVTVLFSRTQPLIRYELSDRVCLSEARCECGRSFGVVQSVEGRIEDVLIVPDGRGGSVSIHPNIFHRVLEPLSVRQWQVVQRADVIEVRIVRGAEVVDGATLADRVRRELEEAGAPQAIVRVEEVAAVEQTAAGKTPLIRRDGSATIGRGAVHP
jgi:putative adenylate-forming enzyme